MSANTYATCPHPLARFNPEEMLQAWDYYTGVCRGLRLQIGGVLNNRAVADGMHPRANVLEWQVHGPLGDLLEEVDGILYPHDGEPEKIVDLAWLEAVISLKVRLEGVLIGFVAEGARVN